MSNDYLNSKPDSIDAYCRFLWNEKSGIVGNAFYNKYYNIFIFYSNSGEYLGEQIETV